MVKFNTVTLGLKTNGAEQMYESTHHLVKYVNVWFGSYQHIITACCVGLVGTYIKCFKHLAVNVWFGKVCNTLQVIFFCVDSTKIVNMGTYCNTCHHNNGWG